jgi:hypothetical protein
MWDFVKYAVVESLDSVPEQFRGLYAENAEKKFALIDAVKPLITAYVGVNTSLADTKKKLTAANDESASRRVTGTAVADFLKSLGVENVNAENPLETLQTHVTSLIEGSKKGAEIKVNMDRIKAEAETRVAAIAKASADKETQMKGTLKKYLISQATTQALAAAKGNVEVLMPHIERYADVIQDGDDYVVRVIDPTTKEARSNGAGGFMSIADLVTEMKGNKTFAANFESETPAGTGGKPSPNTRVQTPANKGGEKTSAQKISSGLTALATQRR